MSGTGAALGLLSPLNPLNLQSLPNHRNPLSPPNRLSLPRLLTPPSPPRLLRAQ